MSELEPVLRKKPTPRRLVGLALVSAFLAIAITIWVSNAGLTGPTECKAQPLAAQVIDGAAHGQLAALNATAKGRGYADLAFQDASGKPMTIKDFAGKALLVNFWASWCIPCRTEMPALNALAEKHNGAGFQVLPINLDIGEGGLEKARAFLKEGNWANLPLYADPTFKAFDRLKTNAVAIGLPATLLLDAKGCELAVLQGPAEWNTPDGDAVVKAVTGLQG
ncbi:MAG: sodium:dicarboxylate symporter [Hyphomicrobiales bacterium]|nr:sodium:dicarboxylate symporter [Hyphomicrobiales bacterium]